MTTVRAVLAESLRRAGRYDPAQVAPPAAVLWPDPDHLWSSAVPLLQDAVPLLVLGPLDPRAATGPAIWMRAVLARSGASDGNGLFDLPPGLPSPEGSPWIVYLPGYSREQVVGDDVPSELLPLLDLHQRGQWWMNHGQVWTPHAFLGSPEGVGLAIAKDARTRATTADVLDALMMEDVDDLRRRGRLDADR